MTTIEATFKGGQIILDCPADWPDGCRLRIEPILTDQLNPGTETDKPETPEEIEEWLRWYHSLEPLEFTPEEEADRAAWRQKVKDYEVAKSQLCGLGQKPW